MKFGMGQSVPRVEDPRLLRGEGRYTDDIHLPGETRAYVLRSPHAKARILSIDISAARGMPGVLDVLTGRDWAEAGLGDMPCIVPEMFPLARPDGAPMPMPPRPALVADIAAHVGDPVALVVAETLAQARDAAEAIEIDYEELPSVTDIVAAIQPGAPAVWDSAPDNIVFVRRIGDHDAVEAALAAADHVARVTIPITRVAQNPMEPRAAVGAWDPTDERYTLYSGTQNPFRARRLLAERVFHVDEGHMRVVSPDMGGAFGMRGNIFPEQALVMWAAKRVGRPVRWNGDRSEGFLSDDHGRDCRMEVELGLSADGTFQALRMRSLAATGAYHGVFSPMPTFGNSGGVAGVYTTPKIAVEVTGVFTNTTQIGPYRGAGRPEAAMAIEQAIDQAALDLGRDRIDLRRQNLIPEDAFPFQTGMTFLYDCGQFEKTMDMSLELGDVAGFPARRAASEAKGLLRGLGVINAIEQAAGVLDDGAEIRFNADGSATVVVGSHNHGQGHETVFRQLLADELGLEFEKVRYVQGDTDRVAYGNGTFGSRTSGLIGSALHIASARIVEKGKRIAAHRLEVAADDIEFAEGRFTVAGTDRSIALDEVAQIAFNPNAMPQGEDSGLSAFATFKHDLPTFPNGSHVCEIEIDPETGVVTVDRYSVVDDVGTVMNPMLLKGQIHGGIVQGIGQLLMEQMVWDEDNGQPVTGSFMDYCMPRADDVPFFQVGSNPVPTPRNPIGVKGAGEAGTVGAMPCVMAAILDALGPLGVKEFAMPASPERVWRAIREAKGA